MTQNDFVKYLEQEEIQIFQIQNSYTVGKCLTRKFADAKTQFRYVPIQ